MLRFVHAVQTSLFACRSCLFIAVNLVNDSRRGAPGVEQIPRSLNDGPDYSPRWRFLVAEQKLVEIVAAPCVAAALERAILAERDPFVRQLLRFQMGRRTVGESSFNYVLVRMRSPQGEWMMRMIAAMVICGRSPLEIAQELGIARFHVVVFEKVLFDVRPCLSNRFWVKQLCFTPAMTPWLGQRASRLLTTAAQRGWAGLCTTFAKSNAASQPAGKKAFDEFRLGFTARSSDFVTSLEINGIDPSAHELALLADLSQFHAKVAPDLHQLDYPKPLTYKEKMQEEEAAKLVQQLSRESRQKIARALTSYIKNSGSTEGDA